MSNATTPTPPRQIHAWNTGRGYSSKGQRIAFLATKQPYDERLGITTLVEFVDVDRMIEGTMLFLGSKAWNHWDVLDAYDHCNYHQRINDREVEEALRAAAEAL